LSLAAAGLICLAYACFVEPYWPEVTHVRLTSGKLPRGGPAIRIVQVSDLHCEAKVRLEGRLPGLITSLSPDLIVFTGDAANSPAGFDNFRRCINALADIAPVYGVRGNWDGLAVYSQARIELLEGEAVKVSAGGSEFYLAGLAMGRDDLIAPTLAKVPPGTLMVLLDHMPDDIEAVAARGVDVYLAGHTHGGQVALPFYGAVITLSKYGKRFEAGLHRVGNTWLYVNRGIGMEGGLAPRIRFLSRPEITLIEIAPQ